MRSLTKTEQWEGSLIPGYEFQAIGLPSGEKYISGIWECDQRSVLVPFNAGHLWLRVTSCADGTLAAYAIFGGDSGILQCDSINVLEEHRRRGIALALYQWSACIFEAPVTPTNKRTTLSKLFWGSKSSIECDCLVSGKMRRCV